MWWLYKVPVIWAHATIHQTYMLGDWFHFVDTSLIIQNGFLFLLSCQDHAICSFNSHWRSSSSYSSQSIFYLDKFTRRAECSQRKAVTTLRHLYPKTQRTSAHMRTEASFVSFPRPARSFLDFWLEERQSRSRSMLGVIVPGARLPDSVSMRMLKVGAGPRGLMGVAFGRGTWRLPCWCWLFRRCP